MMSEINLTYHKSITHNHSCHFLRDDKRVEADFSIWRDYVANAIHVWCLDPEIMKDLF